MHVKTVNLVKLGHVLRRKCPLVFPLMFLQLLCLSVL